MRSGYAASLTRVQIDSVEERDGLQYVTARGLAGERFTGILRAEPHGFASSPPAGAIGVGMPMGGRRDQMVVFGAEHPGHRPIAEPGCSYLYNAHGDIISVVKRHIRITAGDQVTITAPKIALVGNVHLGSEGASIPASMKGTVDSAGHTDVGGLATKVFLT